MSEFFDALETRDPAQREAQLMAALPRQVAHAQRHAGAFAQILAGVDAAAVTSREALARLPVTRKHELLERQKANRHADPFGGFSTLVRGARHAARLCVARADLRARRHGHGLLAHGARHATRRAFAPATWCTTAFSYHMTPGAFMMESGAHARRLHGVPGRRRPDRAAGAGHGRTAPRRLHGHAELPAHPHREGAPRPARTSPACARRMIGGEALPAEPARLVRRARHGGATSAMPRPTWASSPTKPRRAKAWCWTKASSSRSCGPAPATRWPTAKWASWWSRRSTPPIR